MHTIWQNITKEYAKLQLAPKYIEFARWNSWHVVSAFNNQTNRYISESVAMGVSQDLEIATRKAMTEFFERQATRSTVPHTKVATHRSDGFAAFPNLNDQAKIRARQNALNEAVERFLWAKWWDDPSIQHNTLDLHNEHLLQLKLYFGLDKIQAIQIVDAQQKFQLLILIAFNKTAGVFTGGASQSATQANDSESFDRAFGELLRHLLAFQKMGTNQNHDISFYEERLNYFGSGKGYDLVCARLESAGTRLIELPNLVIDTEIPHPQSHLVVLHRCLFAKQPIFMGGALERLCI